MLKLGVNSTAALLRPAFGSRPCSSIPSGIRDSVLACVKAWDFMGARTIAECHYPYEVKAVDRLVNGGAATDEDRKREKVIRFLSERVLFEHVPFEYRPLPKDVVACRFGIEEEDLGGSLVP